MSYSRAEKLVSTSRYLKKYVVSAWVTAAVTVIAFFVDLTGVTWVGLPADKVIRIIPSGVLFSVIIWTEFLGSYVNYPRANDCTIENLWCMFQLVNDRGDLYARYHFDIHNRTGAPLREFRNERVGFLQPPPRFAPYYKVLSPLLDVDGGEMSVNERDIGLGGDVIHASIYEWTAVFTPHVPAGGRVSFRREYFVEQTESGAFEERGAVVSYRVFRPTKFIEIAVLAPPNFLIDDVDHSVVDENGGVLDKIKNRQLSPEIAAGGSVVLWRIYYPQPESRYVLRYRCVNGND